MAYAYSIWQHTCARRCAAALLALTPVLAQTAPAVLEEVIVEGQKTAETIGTTPIAITAVTGEQFQKSASFNLQDIGRTTPGLSFDTGVTPDIHLRGVSTVTLAAVSLRTNIYQDGALIEQPRALFDAQYDIERFEILKGPQGTLYGKSSPTGTINIRTRNPNMNTVDGYLATSLAQRDTVNTQFGISVPLIEGKLALRLAAVYDENRASGQKNITTGAHAQSRSSGGRVTALWQPAPAFSARLSYNYRERKENPWYTLDGDGFRYDRDQVTVNTPDLNRVRDQLTVLELDWSLSDNLSLTSVSAYEEQDYRNVQDTDGTASPLAANPQLPGGDVQLTQIPLRSHLQQDLRLASIDNPLWDWQIGIYYHRQSTATSVRSLRLADQGGFVAPVDVYTTAILASEEHALYTHNTFKLTDQFNVIVGARYQDARYRSRQPTTGYAYFFGLDQPPIELVPDFIPAEGIPAALGRQTYYPVTGTVKLQYFFDPDLMGYVTVDRAYRTGAANLNIQGNTPADFARIEPETANSIEFGLKGSFGHQRGRFAATVFDQVYKNFQQDVQNIWVWNPGIPGLTDGPSLLQNIVASADKAETRGVELQLTWLLLDNWDIDIAAAYTASKYKDFADNPCSPLPTPSAGAPGPLTPATPYVVCDLSGKRLPQAPRWSGVISSNYTWPAFGGAAQWYIGTLINISSAQVDKVTRRDLGGYATADFFAGLRREEGNSWDIGLWVKNAFDRRVITRIYNSQMLNPVSGGHFDMVTTNLPRQAGITATYRFK